jgi:6-pyruvoyltetrahydropterin/6-carboxytetrahydropterin synthase
MSNITCTRRLEFDAAHRVMLHESKCKNLHGHRYAVEATFAADGLDSLGRVVDFGVIKTRLGAWLDEHFDHNTILHEADRPLGELISAQLDQRIYYLPYNPTAENIARYLLEVVCPPLFADCAITCINIRVYETPNCHADANFKGQPHNV